MLRMKMERKRKGRRQEDLAHFAKVSCADISRIESGRLRPYPGHAARLARALGVKPQELLEEVGES